MKEEETMSCWHIPQEKGLLDAVFMFALSNLEALRGQVAILYALTPHHPDRKQHIKNARQMTLYLVEKLNAAEEHTNTLLEQECEELINDTAEVRDVVSHLAKELHEEDLCRCAGALSEYHDRTVKVAGAIETDMSKMLRKKFGIIRTGAEVVLKQLDDLSK